MNKPSTLSKETSLVLVAAAFVFLHPYTACAQSVSFAGVQTTLTVSVGGVGLNQPYGVAVDRAGDVFIADTANNRVVEIPAGGGAQTTVGTGLSYPYGVAVDGAGDVFIADTRNNRVVEVPWTGTSYGTQTTLDVSVGGSGLNQPGGVAVDGAGDVFIADTHNSRVVEVPAGCTSAACQTTVGIGLNDPIGVAVDGAGDVFIADYGNNRVVEVPGGGGAQTTVGSGLTSPGGVAVDGAGDVFIADTFNNRAVEVQWPAVNFGSVNICPGGQTTPAPCSQTLSLNYSVNDATTFASNPTVLTQGAPNLDFTLSSNTCAGTITAPGSCTVNVSFAPLAPGLRMGAVQLTDSSANLLVTTFVHGLSQGPAIAFGPGAQTTLNVSVGGSGLYYPYGVAVDEAGDVFIADQGNNRVVEVPAGGGAQTTVGSGLSLPAGVAVDGAGEVFIADTNHSRVVEVPAGCTTTTCQTTVNVSVGGIGLSGPTGIAVDGAGDVFIADTNHSRVVEVPAGCTSAACQTTVNVSVGGRGLYYPWGVAVDGAGDVFIADMNHWRVVEVPAGGGAQTTVGSGLNSPYGVAVDGAGDVFIADTYNNRVVEVPAGGGAQTTVGSGLIFPYGVAVDGAGDVFIVDTSNSRVVEVERSGAPTFSFAATEFGSTSTDSPQSVTVQNIGNQSLDAVPPGLSIGATSFVQVPGSGTPADCTSSLSLQPGASCNLSVSFIPQTTGSIVSAATFTDNALNATAAAQSVSLSGTGNPAPLTITASSATMAYGGTVPTITPGYSGFVNGDTPASLTTPPTCSTTATSHSPAGSYPSSCTGAADSNYTISYVNGTVVDSPAPLVITASSATMAYGGTVPTITPGYSGFVNGDTPASLTTPPTCSTTATSTSPPGSYPSSCSGAVDSNYTISYVNGTVTVIAPLVSLSFSSLTFPAEIVGTRSSAQTVTLTNTGNASLTMSSITASGDFSQTHACGATLSASANCTIAVTFKPLGPGTSTGAVVITDNANGSPQTVALSGTGVVFTSGPHPPVLPPRPPSPVPGRPPMPPTVPPPGTSGGTGTEPVVHSPGPILLPPSPPVLPAEQPAPPPTAPSTGNLSQTGKKDVVRPPDLTVLPLWPLAHPFPLQQLLLL
jgi:sugar lactone lactonase YvrE